MSLNISSNISSNQQNVSFGMAKFSKKGYEMVSKHSDIYESLAKPNNFQNPDFFKSKFLFFKAPFTRYFLDKTKTGGQNGAEEAAKTIIACGTTDNSGTNAKFIKQLIATGKYIHSSSEETQKTIGKAANEVFKKNWDNPELSKKDTLSLLDIAKYDMDDRTYVSLNGAINSSNAK